jgi:hypothetical protein
MLTVKAAGADVSKEAHLWPATVRDYRGPGRLDPPDWHGPIGGLVAWFQTQVRAIATRRRRDLGARALVVGIGPEIAVIFIVGRMVAANWAWS